MARRPVVPPPLTHGPFTLDDADRQGLNRRHLVSSAWKRIGPGVYAHRALTLDEAVMVEAAHRRAPVGAVFSGRTAAWLHGLDVSPGNPPELTIPAGAPLWTRSGIRLRHARLEPEEIVVRRTWRVTSIERTLLDLALGLPLLEAVVMADMALQQLTTLERMEEWMAGRAGRPGIARLRRVLALVEPRSESAMESRLRVLLVLGGLPAPQAQVDLHDRGGRFLGRADLYYPEQRLALEYDGGVHRTRLVQDNRRQNRLLAAGYRLLRFTAPDLLATPAATLAQVRSALGLR